MLTWAGEPLNFEASGLREPRGKLDTIMVNGPEDVFDWDAVNWRAHEQDVARLRQRIFKATREQDWATARSLQKMMLASWSNTLLSVRQVTQRNTGRQTAGVDGEIALTPQARAEVAVQVHRSRSSWDPLPVRRVYVPKANGKQRPLGIPVIMDRCHQARVRNALEPEWEARFEPRSYGFRPGRSCADAIASLYSTLKGPGAQRVWILDADLSAAFDRIDHARLLESLGSFPARGLIARWLTAGVVEKEVLAPTEEGTPQGGVISPLLMNVALHGLEEAAGARYRTIGVHAGNAVSGTPNLVRYADDLVVCCYSEEQAREVKARLAGWLAPRGLTFNEDKTRRPPRERFRLPRLQHPPIPARARARQATDQTQPGSGQANTEEARDRGAQPARLERDGDHRPAQPDHSGLGRLLPGRGVQQDLHCTGSLRVVADLPVGPAQPPEEVEEVDRAPLLRLVQQVQER